MNSKNIVLIGFMGSGKSSTSRALSQLLQRPFLSTDEMAVDIEGRTIAQIFEVRGEAYFRSLERRIIKDISQQQNQILDCGGGVIKDPDNVADLKKSSVLIYLKTSPEWIHRRTKNVKTRPLLNVDDPMAQIEKLLKERQPLYESAADVVVNTDGKTPEKVAGEIVKLLKIYP